MSCTLPLVFIAGLYISPCEIQELKPREETFPTGIVEECVVKYRANGALDREYASRIKAPCKEVADAIQTQTQTQKKEKCHEEIID